MESKEDIFSCWSSSLTQYQKGVRGKHEHAKYVLYVHTKVDFILEGNLYLIKTHSFDAGHFEIYKFA